MKHQRRHHLMKLVALILPEFRSRQVPILYQSVAISIRLKDSRNRLLFVVKKQTHYLERPLVFVAEKWKMREKLHALPLAHLCSKHLHLERLEDLRYPEDPLVVLPLPVVGVESTAPPPLDE